MEILSVVLMLVSVVAFPVGVIMLIIQAIRRKKKLAALIVMLSAVVLFVASVIIMPVGDMSSGDGGSVSEEAYYSASEVFAGEFCMAYMNHLKNPYSFEVKSVHVADLGEGRFSAYVKFTAENGLGATVADEIGTMTMGAEELEKLASDAMYIDIYIWGNEPPYGSVELDAAKVQSYIAENYK